MRTVAGKIFGFVGSREFLLFLVLSFSFYILIERVGLFRLESAHYREILHSHSYRILGGLFAVHAVCGILLNLNGKLGLRNTGTLLFYLSIIVLVMGQWGSILTRFEGRTLKSEMERFNAFQSEYDPQSLFVANNKKMPRVKLTVIKIDPEVSSDTKHMEQVNADILYSSRSFRGVREGKLSSSRPLFTDWTMIRITDFGYVPKFILYDLQERELESRWVHMKLFPPGAEDYFETMFMGYLFYMKCFPDFTEINGVHGTESVRPDNPVFNLRIVRNKDIVFNGLLRPHEKLRFDNHVIAVPDVKMWIEISFVRDIGVPIAFVGMIIMILSVILMMRKG